MNKLAFHRHLLHSTLLAAIAAPAIAQYQVVYEDLSVTSAPTGAVAGHITGLGYPDLVFLAGGRLHLLSSPSVRNSTTSIPVMPNDYEVVPGVNGATDELLVVGASGLSRWRLDAQNGPATWTETVLNDHQWLGATMLTTGDINADGVLDAVGLASDGRTILAHRSDGGNAVIMTLLPIQNAQGLQFLDYDGNGTDELAVVTNFGAIILDDQLSTVIQSIGGSAASSQVGTVRSATGSRELLVWAHHSAASGSGLRIAEAGQPLLQFSLGSQSPVVSLTSGFRTGLEPFENICYQLAGSDSVHMLGAQNTLPRFSMASRTQMKLFNQGPVAPGGVVLRDFDGDGDDDVFALRKSAGRWALASNTVVDADASRVEFNVCYQEALPSSLAHSRRFHASFVLANNASILSLAPSATHVQVRVWEASVDPTRASNLVIAGRPLTDFETGPQEVPLGNQVVLDLDRNKFDNEGYLVVVRAVRRSSTGELKRVFPPSTSIWAKHLELSSGGFSDSPMVEFAERLPAVGVNSDIYGDASITRLDASLLWMLPVPLLRGFDARAIAAIVAVARPRPMSGKVTGVEIPLPPTPPLPPDAEDEDEPPVGREDVPKGG